MVLPFKVLALATYHTTLAYVYLNIFMYDLGQFLGTKKCQYDGAHPAISCTKFIPITIF